jgi:hypothetical protein
MSVGLVALLPPVLDSDGDDPADPRGAQFEAGFVNGCLETSPSGIPPDVARRYCECLLGTLRRGRDTAELERLARYQAGGPDRSGTARCDRPRVQVVCEARVVR